MKWFFWKIFIVTLNRRFVDMRNRERKTVGDRVGTLFYRDHFILLPTHILLQWGKISSRGTHTGRGVKERCSTAARSDITGRLVGYHSCTSFVSRSPFTRGISYSSIIVREESSDASTYRVAWLILVEKLNLFPTVTACFMNYWTCLTNNLSNIFLVV